MGAAAVWTGVKALGSWLFKTTTGNIVLGAATSAAASSAMTPKPKTPEIKVAPPTVTPTAAKDITTAKQEERRKQKLKQGLAATMKTGGMGLTSRANINKPVLGTTSTGKKTLLGQ
jgi:hypothetical protein